MGWMRCTRICPASWPVSNIGFYAHLPYPVDTNLLKWNMFLMKEPRSHGIGEPTWWFWQGKNNLNKKRKQPDLGSSEVFKMGFMSGIAGLVISLRLSDSTMWQIWRASLEQNAIKGGKQMDPLQRNVTKNILESKKHLTPFPSATLNIAIENDVMWVKRCHKPAIWEWFIYTTYRKNVMTGGWFMALFYHH